MAPSFSNTLTTEDASLCKRDGGKSQSKHRVFEYTDQEHAEDLEGLKFGEHGYKYRLLEGRIMPPLRHPQPVRIVAADGNQAHRYLLHLVPQVRLNMALVRLSADDRESRHHPARLTPLGREQLDVSPQRKGLATG